VNTALTPFSKSVFALGDFTTNTVLASLSLIYASHFLIEIAGLRPALAGLVPLIGRAVDAFTDPAMGRLSDLTRWRLGRRRPYFLIGAAPFGVSFAMLWFDPPFVEQSARFAYYTLTYCLLSVSITVLSIPYLALLPEMVLDYDGRTALNTYRHVGSVLGIAAAIGIRPLATAFGGGSDGFALAGITMGFVVALPWLAVYRVTFEREDFRQRAVGTEFVEGLKIAARHRTFRQLSGMYLCGRIAMDVMGALLVVYFTYWIGRSGGFELLMLAFLPAVVLTLPAWLSISRHSDKATIFLVGSVWWIVALLPLLIAQPDWPTWMLMSFGAFAGVGYAAVDLMPWAMIGDVIDEDDLLTGERREGLYNGVLTFLRKLSGALAVFLVLTVLDLAGLKKGAQQSESVLMLIRGLTSLAPALFLIAGVWLTRGYAMTRVAHAHVLEQLDLRDATE
jgi:sugar (glycoside-pentoside-hexuronide) transporter